MPEKFVTGAILDEKYDPNTRKFHYGDRYRDGNKEYVLVLYNAGVGSEAGTEGHCVAQMDSDFGWFECTADLDDPNAVLNQGVGQLQVTLADGEACWAQYKGPNRKALVTNTNVAQGSKLVLVSTAAGAIGPWVSGAGDIGCSLAADAAAVLAAGSAYLNFPI